MFKSIRKSITLLLLLAVLLSACTAPPAATQAPAEPPAATEAAAQPPAETEAPAPTEAPTEPPAATEPPAEPELPMPGEAGHLVLATTTSTEDSGLLDFILPDFEKEAGVVVDVIAVGTGQALQLGKDGNADVLLVHARAREDEFMSAGDGVRREDVMYNDFVILGPESDPAGLLGMTDAADAFKKIAEAEQPFISRGDDSGTHSKEKSIWQSAELEPDGGWYVSAGQGMGEVLTMAAEQQAYTLSDRATYLARTLQGLDLVLVVEGDPILFNPYGVIAVNPEKNPNIQSDLAQKFIDWLISVPVQEKIAEFGKEEFGQSLFIPDSTLYKESKSAEMPAEGMPALKITGKVAEEQAWTEAEVMGLPTTEVETTNKQGEAVTYTGVLLSELLQLAQPASDAATVIFVADDGYTAEIALAELMACTDCILAFREEGGFSTVLPGFPGNMQVKGVVEIQVK